MTVTINGTSGITTPGVNSTASNTLGDAVGDTLNVGNGTIVTDSSGNVGIGTSSPNEILNLYKASRPYLVMQNATTGTTSSDGFWIGYDSTNLDVQIRNKENANLLFCSNDTERMRIDSSGRILMNTTSWTGGICEVKSGSAGGECYRAWNATDSGTRYFHYFGVGSASFSNVGSITSTGSTTAFNTTSDYRLKENIQPMQNALGVVAQLNPVTYNWKADGSDGQGFIAHELQAVVPDCVTGEKDAVQTVDVLDDEGRKIGAKEEPVYQGIDTSFLVATLCKAIQELNAKVTSLEEQVLNLGVTK